MHRIIRYLRTHLWYTVSFAFGIVMIFMAICYQGYMKYKYADFLLEKNYLMEAAVIDTMQQNLDYSLLEYINVGAKIAIDQDIYDLSEDIFMSGKTDVTRDIWSLRANLSVMAGMSSSILNISVVSSEGEACQYDRLLRNDIGMWSGAEEQLAQIYEDLHVQVNNSEASRYIVVCAPAEHPTRGEKVFHIFYPLIGKNYSFSYMNTMLAITYRLEVLTPFLESSMEEENPYSDRYITDETGTIIYHSNPAYLGESEDNYLASSSFITLGKKLDRSGWTLHAALDKIELNRNVDGILRQGMTVYFALLIVLAVAIYVILQKIAKPLNKIKTAMSITGDQGRRKKVDVEGIHEIWQVAEGYNEMLYKLELQEKEVKRQYQLTLLSLERQHQAEWEALETQINAHFLCNTLGTINYEAIEGGNVKVSQLIKKLSNILRYTFDQKHQKVYLRQEFAWIEQYLYLQKARLEDVFDYQIEMDEKFSQWPCCKLMLQPFVENAIIHGFEGWETGGKLLIKAEQKNESLMLTIQDNGCGIPEDKCRIIKEMLNGETLEATTDIGIGIRNVASRMRMFYGESVRLTLTSEPGERTEFVFMIPFPEKQERGGNNAIDDC